MFIDPVTERKKNILTFISNYTNYTEICLLKNKYEVSVAKSYILKVEGQQTLKVSKIRCDNGREYINNNLKEWTYKKGIYNSVVKDL